MSTMENTIEAQAEAPKTEAPKEDKKKKDKTFAKGLGKLSRYMRKYKLPILIATAFTLVSTVFMVLAPGVMSDLTNVIVDATWLSGTRGLPIDIPMGEIAAFGAILIIYYVAGNILDYIQTFIMVQVNNSVAMDLRGKISQKINKVPLKYYDKNTVGDVLSRTTNDIDRISDVLNWQFTALISHVAMIIGTLIAMFWHS